ncbi:MAG: carbohydrate ABC transporter substrate-binding protein [Acholeplasmatales bacterium]|nr:MAG: carbohydrate ABC transporter substrate-binding protein [Acholeplasmatales bacterium]
MKKMLISFMMLVSFLALSACGTRGDADTIELNVFMSFPRFQEEFEAYFLLFEQKMLEEEGIKVKVNLEMASSDTAQQLLQARLSSNDAPDVYTLHAIADIPAYYEAGYLADLSDAAFTDLVFESVLESVTYADKILALPLESLAWGYLYNKDIFTQYDLTPPQTLSEMEHVVSVLQENDQTPFLLAFQESWIPQLMMALALGAMVNSEAPNFIDNMNAGTGSYADIAEVFDIIDLIMANGTDRAFETGGASGSADFANGAAAMWVQGPWMSGSILEVNPDMNIGLAPLPVTNNEGTTMINLSTSTSLGVSPTSENKDLAIKLLNFILDPEHSSDLFSSLKFAPLASVHEYETFPWIDEAMTYVEAGKAYLERPLPPGVTDETAVALQEYYLGDKTRQQVIDAIDNAWRSAVD